MKRIGLLLLVPVLFGCDDEGLTGASGMRGEFRLTHAEGEPVPVTLGTEQRLLGDALHTCTLDVLEGRLLLREGDQFTLEVTSVETCVRNGSESRSQDSNSASGTFSGGGGGLVLVASDSMELNDHDFVLGTAAVAGAAITVPLSRSESPYSGTYRLRFASSGS